MNVVPYGRERENDPARGQMARKAHSWERERKNRPRKGKKLARKAERENIILDPERGGGCS